MHGCNKAEAAVSIALRQHLRHRLPSGALNARAQLRLLKAGCLNPAMLIQTAAHYCFRLAAMTTIACMALPMQIQRCCCVVASSSTQRAYRWTLLTPSTPQAAGTPPSCRSALWPNFVKLVHGSFNASLNQRLCNLAQEVGGHLVVNVPSQTLQESGILRGSLGARGGGLQRMVPNACVCMVE